MTLPLLHIAAHMRTAAANWRAAKEPETPTEDFYDAAFYDGWQTAVKWLEELAGHGRDEARPPGGTPMAAEHNAQEAS